MKEQGIYIIRDVMPEDAHFPNRQEFIGILFQGPMEHTPERGGEDVYCGAIPDKFKMGGTFFFAVRLERID